MSTASHQQLTSQGLLRKTISRRQFVVSLIVLALLVIVLAPQTDALHRSLSIISGAAPWSLVAAGMFVILTYMLSAAMYSLLVRHKLPMEEILTVQAATALTARLVPIGLGTMGLNALYLRQRKHSTAEAVTVVATNNGLSAVAHLLLFAAMSVTAAAPVSHSYGISWKYAYWIGLVIFLAAIALTWSDRARRSIAKGLHTALATLATYRREQRTIVSVILLSMLLSTAYIMSLLAVSQSLGVVIPFNQVFVIYTISLLTGIATPTPGGLVGVEAGLVAGYVAYGVDADTALAVALLYRLLTYWIPLIPGYIAFRIVQRRYF